MGIYMTKVYEQWQDLCKEFEIARETHFQAFTVVNKAFASVSTSGVTENPTIQQLEIMENSWNKLENIKLKMDDFCKNNIQ